jgi:hypothetical protein
MNFFGHAMVSRQVGVRPAAEFAGNPGYALGSMLPDFASMCGGRIAGAADPAVAAGIELHHRTDAVFHRLAPVVALMRELAARLRTAGCTRGPTLAVSHVGVELLLDGVLVEDSEGQRLYVDALDYSGASVAWQEPLDGDRFGVLHERLRQHGVPHDLGRPQAVTERLLRLQRRPRLAPSAAEAVMIGVAIAEMQPHVQIAAESVVRDLYAGLATR